MSEEPRIAPLPTSELPAEVAATVSAAGGSADQPQVYNIFRTLARHPALFRSWLPFGGYLLGQGTLPARDRELLILRTAVRCGSSYEWGQHVRIAARAGIERESIDRVAEGPDASGWSEHEEALLRAADELHQTSTISDRTWEALAQTYDDAQMIEATVLVGQYHLVAFALNACGVPLDDGLETLPGGA